MTFTNAIVYNNGMVIWVPPITLKALCNVNIKYWPYDEHNCFLKFGSWTFDGHVMDVTPMNKTNPGLLKDIWKNTEFHITYINVTRDVKYYDCCREPYPSVTFFFKLQRRPTLYHYIISMPAIVAIISSLATFWLPIRSNNRFILNSVSLIILSLLLIFLGIQFGMSSFGVPIAVRFISLTTLFVGLLQVWITIAFNTSQLKGQIPVWAMKFTKPLIQLYRNTEHESIQLTQSEQTADVTNKKSVAKHPNAEDLTFIVDKLLFIVFTFMIIINSLV
ncbi:acetylcholine receptor subunit alpha-type acr-16-like [Oppia nitens]|uniref:acetylcholine receptor subunit alpha-type acr-16-like n=1 Tax=Oppia nitens TaxID=1686743 RepID=UPI0023DAACA8|nr:acetylcholine receptor subunit alpha-type acr-16-like [Oppia nitens]